MTPGFFHRVTRIEWLYDESRFLFTLEDGTEIRTGTNICDMEIAGDNSVGDFFFRKSMLADSDEV